MKNDVIRKDEISKCRDSLRKDISLAISNINSLSSSLLLEDSLHTMGWCDSFRALLLGLNNSEPAYKNMILNSTYHINSSCSLGIPLYLLSVEWLLKNKDHDFDNLLSQLSTSKRVNSSKVIEEWEKTIHDLQTVANKHLFLEAAKAAGSFGSIVVEKTEADSGVEIDCGSKFSCDAHPFFHSADMRKIEFEKCLIVVVDGAIIEVSEIHHLLTYCYENAVPCVLIAGSFSDDVANTLRVNWEKKLVSILPLISDKELENINQTRDLCQVANILPVSKDTGMLISNMSFEECVLNDVTYLLEISQLSISTTSKNFHSVKMLRENIIKNLENEKVDDIREILKKRLSQLSTRKAIIKVRCKANELGMLKDRAGNLFQFLSCSGRQGVVSVQPIFKLIGVDPSPNMPTILPAKIAENSIRRAISDVRAINKIMTIIKLDHNDKMENI